MKIRNVKNTDLQEILALERLVFSYDQLNERSLLWMATKANALFKVLLVDKKVIGYTIILFRKNSASARLYSIALHPSFQGKGYGHKLLFHIFKYLKIKAYNSVTLEVKISNHNVIALYKKMGFIFRKKKLRYYDDGSDALYFEKKL